MRAALFTDEDTSIEITDIDLAAPLRNEVRVEIAAATASCCRGTRTTGSVANASPAGRPAAIRLRRSSTPLAACSTAPAGSAAVGSASTTTSECPRGPKRSSSSTMPISTRSSRALPPRFRQQRPGLHRGVPGHRHPGDLRPLISAAHRKPILDVLAKTDGTILTGGKALPGDGFFLEPTVVANPSQADVLVQTEQFGPVVTV